MKKKAGMAIINWIEAMLLIILNFSLNIGLIGHICLLSYAFIRFIHGIADLHSMDSINNVENNQ